MEYKVNLKKIGTEDFEKDRNNSARASVQNNDGDDLTNKSRVKLFMSKNAMLGLGKELIRAAHRKVKADVWHFYPAKEIGNIHETFGIVLMPESVEPILIDDEPVEIDKILYNK